MTKVEDSLFHLAAVHDGRAAQGSPGDDDRAAPHFVLDDFMCIEKVMAVSACFLAVGDSNYRRIGRDRSLVGREIPG